MKTVTALLTLAMLAKSKFSSAPIGEELEPVKRNIDEERVLLELPDHVVKIGRDDNGYYTMPSEYPLMHDVVETFRTLMSERVWFSPCLRTLSEEEWVSVLNAEFPLARLQYLVRLRELKYKILKVKI